MRAEFWYGPHLVLALAVLMAPAESAAQAARMTWDNDLIGLRGTGAPPDHDYTNGLQVSWRSGGGLALLLAQEIYTPRRDSVAPVPGERPYAAWSYGEVGWSEVDDEGGGKREVALALGVIGPAAFGEEVQNTIHALTGSQRQKGWPHQLRISPTIQFRYRRQAKVRLDPSSDWSLQPYWVALLGNVRTGVQLGVPLLFRMDPSLDQPSDGFGFGLDLAVRALLRDALLDEGPGNLQPVERNPVVAEGRIGAGYKTGAWSLTYAFTISSREYTSQAKPHPLGSLSLVWRPQQTSS